MHISWEKQNHMQPDERPLLLKGISDKRWNCRGSSCQHLHNEVVYKAVLNTIEYVCTITTDGNSILSKNLDFGNQN